MPIEHEFEDPKIILTASILRQRDIIVNLINSSNEAAALKAMATLITQCCIDKCEKDLVTIKNELVQNTIYSTIPASKTMHYWQLINDYLNITYFADYHKAKPKVSEEGHI